MKKVYLIIIGVFLLSTAVQSQQKGSFQKNTSKDFIYKPFDILLQKYVSSEGEVNYKDFKNEQKALKSYLLRLSKVNLENGFSENEKLAFYINLYNAATILLILQNHPLKSIMDIDNGKAWDIKFVVLNNNKISLNELENEIIRKKFREPRIHFALNCAAKSCPKLNNRAYIPEYLNVMLEDATLSFLKNSEYNQISRDKLQISKIFEWYEVDFKSNGGIIPFISKYSSFEIDKQAKIVYNEYNWQLNGY